MDIKLRSGGKWVDVKPRKRSGGKWVDAVVYKRSGGKWVKISTQKYTKTYNASWTQSYAGNNTKVTNHRSQKLCQGRYDFDPYWGLTKSLIGFSTTASKDLQGATIDKVQLYLRNEHWYWYAGGTAVIGYHNHSVRPTKFSHTKGSVKKQKFTGRGQAKWITMPKALGNGIRDKKYRGVSLYISSHNMEYYGVFSGVNQGKYKPKLKITYTK